MGYDIWVADDPGLAALDAAFDAADDGGEFVQPEDSGYPYFACNNRMFARLGREMVARRMLDGRVVIDRKRRVLIEDWRFSPSCGRRIPPGQILASLSRAGGPPLTLNGKEEVKLWREWIEFLRVAAAEHGGIVVT